MYVAIPCVSEAVIAYDIFWEAILVTTIICHAGSYMFCSMCLRVKRHIDTDDVILLKVDCDFGGSRSISSHATRVGLVIK